MVLMLFKPLGQLKGNRIQRPLRKLASISSQGPTADGGWTQFVVLFWKPLEFTLEEKNQWQPLFCLLNTTENKAKLMSIIHTKTRLARCGGGW